MTILVNMKNHIDTQLIHAHHRNSEREQSVCTPIFQSANYRYRGEDDYHKIQYLRLNNSPNHEVLHKTLAKIENAEAAMVTSSGMAAITSTLLSTLKFGDHLLAQPCLYGGTHTFLTRDIKDYGISVDFLIGNDPERWAQQVNKNTRAIYVEPLSNPLLQVANLHAILELCKRLNLVSIIDNTFLSPINFQPIPFGFDICIHSATKYLNGHSDIVAGAIISNRSTISRIKKKLDHLGSTLDPHACFLLERGLKTLSLRMARHNQSAQTLAEMLEAHPKVKHVFYPGLPNHPDHSIAVNLFSGFGGVLSFEVKGGVNAACAVIKELKIPVEAPSLGSVETLVTRPSTTSHAGISSSERAKIGITDSLIRVSVGVESPIDILQDFEFALNTI